MSEAVASKAYHQYAAFVSYRHVEPDRKWAKWIHRALETYRVPKRLRDTKGMSARVGRVFRDEDELSASSNLSKSIEEALVQSRFLLVVCSPRTPMSRWVNEEVLRFLDMDRGERILALLTEGEPRDSFPPSLCEIRRSITNGTNTVRKEIEEIEPLAADVRRFVGRSPRQCRRLARLRIISAILGCRFDDLRSREQERRVRQLTWLGACLATLLILIGALAGIAIHQHGVAQAERDRARAAGLVQVSERVQDEDPMLALLLAKEAVNLHESFSSVSRLRGTLMGSPLRSVLRGHDDRIISVQFSPSGDRVLTAALDGTCRFWSLDGEEIIQVPYDGKGGQVPVLSGNGRRILVPVPDGLLLVDSSDGQVLKKEYDDDPQIEFLTPMAGGDQVLVGIGNHAHIVNFDLEVLRRLEPHDARVLCALVLEDENLIVICTASGSVYRWPQAGSRPRVLRANRPITRLWRLHTGNQFLARSKGETFVVSLHGKERLDLLPIPIVDSISLDRHGAWLFYGSDTSLRLKSEDRVGEVLIGPEEQTPRFVTVSHNQEWIATGRDDGAAIIWNLDGKEIATLRVADRRISGAAFSPSGHLIATHGNERTARIWAVAGSESGQKMASNVSARVDGWSAEGRRFLTVYGNRAQVWDWEGQSVASLDGHGADISSARFSPSGGQVVTSSMDRTVRLWDLPGGTQQPSMMHEDGLRDARVSPRGDRILSITFDGSVHLWGTGANRIRTLSGPSRNTPKALFSDDGERILMWDGKNQAHLWTAEGERVAALAIEDKRVIDACFLPRGARPMLRTATRATIWDRNGSSSVDLRKPTEAFTGVAFSPSGNRIVTFGLPARIWNDRGAEVAALRRYTPSAVVGGAWSPDSRQLITFGRDSVAYLWRVPDISSVQLEGHKAPILAAAFSPGGGHLATGAKDGVVILWSKRGQPLSEFQADETTIVSVEFDPLGSRLLTRSAYGATCLWLVETGDLLSAVELRTLRDLSYAERVEYREYLGNPGEDPMADWARQYAEVLLEGIELEAKLDKIDPDWKMSEDPSVTQIRDRLWDLQKRGNDLMAEAHGTDFGTRHAFDYALEVIAMEDPRAARRIRMDTLRRMQVGLTQGSMALTRALLERYKSERGRYPTEGEGLRALIGVARESDLKPIFLFLDSFQAMPEEDKQTVAKRLLLHDAWGTMLLYERQEIGVRIGSAGPDRKAGTKDDLPEPFR